MALSAALAITPTPHVPLSAGSVRVDTLPWVWSQGPHDGRRGAVGRPEVPSVVDEPRVLELLDGATRPGRLEPVRQRRTPAGGVDHEIGVDLLAPRWSAPR